MKIRINYVFRSICCMVLVIVLLSMNTVDVFANLDNERNCLTEQKTNAGVEIVDVNESEPEDNSKKSDFSKIDSQVKEAYETICEYIESNSLQISVTLEAFNEEYTQGSYDSVDECLQVWLDELSQVQPLGNEDTSDNEGISLLSSSSSAYWYYNTGMTLYEKPDYSRETLKNSVFNSNNHPHG